MKVFFLQMIFDGMCFRHAVFFMCIDFAAGWGFSRHQSPEKPLVLFPVFCYPICTVHQKVPWEIGYDSRTEILFELAGQ